MSKIDWEIRNNNRAILENLIEMNYELNYFQQNDNVSNILSTKFNQ